MEQLFSPFKDIKGEILDFEIENQNMDNLSIFQISVPLTATKSVVIMWIYNFLCSALQCRFNFIQKYFSLLK